jgi:hypothetical protein
MSDRDPAAEDWYRRGAADAVAAEREAVAASLRLPFLRIIVERSHRLGASGTERPAKRDEAEQGGAEGLRVGPISLPAPRKTAYYVGLAALAAFEVVEWPVAAAIAAGTWVAQHTRPEAPTVAAGPWEFLHRGSHDGQDGQSDVGVGAPVGASAQAQGGQPRPDGSEGS